MRTSDKNSFPEAEIVGFFFKDTHKDLLCAPVMAEVDDFHAIALEQTAHDLLAKDSPAGQTCSTITRIYF